jgi:hypothetical protein
MDTPTCRRAPRRTRSTLPRGRSWRESPSSRLGSTSPLPITHSWAARRRWMPSSSRQVASSRSVPPPPGRVYPTRSRPRALLPLSLLSALSNSTHSTYTLPPCHRYVPASYGVRPQLPSCKPKASFMSVDHMVPVTTTQQSGYPRYPPMPRTLPCLPKSNRPPPENSRFEGRATSTDAYRPIPSGYRRTLPICTPWPTPRTICSVAVCRPPFHNASLTATPPLFSAPFLNAPDPKQEGSFVAEIPSSFTTTFASSYVPHMVQPYRPAPKPKSNHNPVGGE